MFKRFQGFIAGFLFCTIFTSGLVFAKTGSETIEALFNDIKIFVDGVKIEAKDGNGNPVEPFTNNGTTYLPVRAVGEAVGKKVTWDSQTNSVYLTEPNADTSLLQPETQIVQEETTTPEMKGQRMIDVCRPYDFTRGTICTVDNERYVTVASKKYTDAFVFYPQNDGYIGSRGYIGGQYRGTSIAYFNLDAKYKTMTFEIGRVDGSAIVNAKMKIYLDGEEKYKLDLNAESIPQKHTISLNYAKHMKIEIDNPADTDWAMINVALQ